MEVSILAFCDKAKYYFVSQLALANALIPCSHMFKSNWNFFQVSIFITQINVGKI